MSVRPIFAKHAQMQGSDDRSFRAYQRIAPVYDLLDLPFELGRYRSIRPLLFRGLDGRLLDAGVGTGRNIEFYPPGCEVIGVDQSPAMLERASRRRPESNATIQLIETDLTRLPFEQGYFDAAVASFVFCAMKQDQRLAALRELSRVVKPSGRIRLLEYAPARTPFRRGLSRLWQPWVDWAFAATLDHDIEEDLANTSLRVVSSVEVTAAIKLVEAAAA